MAHYNPVASSFRSKVTVNNISAIDDWMSGHVGFFIYYNNYHQTVNNTGVSTVSISRGLDTNVEYLALLDPKL